MFKIIDLTTTLSRNMLTTPSPGHHPGFQLERTADFIKDGKTVSKLTFGTHTGTHTDAPLHFIQDGLNIDEVPLDALVGEAVVIDMSHKGAQSIITAQDLEESNADVKAGDILVIRTNWSKKWGSQDYYKKRPGLSEGAAQWIVKKQVKSIAVDMSGVDPPSQYGVSPKEGGSPVHKILLGNNIYITEYLQNIDQISSKRFMIVILPLKIEGAEAAPSRVIAIEGM